MVEVWDQRVVLKIISCVTLKRSLALYESHFPHLKIRIIPTYLDYITPEKHLTHNRSSKYVTSSTLSLYKSPVQKGY